MTRFQNVGEHVDYEVAQQSIYAVRTSGDALNPTAEELEVYCAKTVNSDHLLSVRRITDVHSTQGNKLRSHVTPTGLLFSTISNEAPTFHEFFPELEELLGKVDFTKLPWRRSIRYEGRFNWKTM